MDSQLHGQYYGDYGFGDINGNTNTTYSQSSNTGSVDDDINISLSEVYTNNIEGFSFNYPRSWDIENGSDFGEDVILVLFAPSNSDYETNIGVRKRNVNKTFYGTKSNFQEEYSYLNELNIIDLTDIYVNGIQMRKVMYSYLNDSYSTLICVEYFYAIGQDMYTISCASLQSNFSEYEPYFDAIINSFQVDDTEKSLKFITEPETVITTTETTSTEPTKNDDFVLPEWCNKLGLTFDDFFYAGSFLSLNHVVFRIQYGEEALYICKIGDYWCNDYSYESIFGKFYLYEENSEEIIKDFLKNEIYGPIFQPIIDGTKNCQVANENFMLTFDLPIYLIFENENNYTIEYGRYGDISPTGFEGYEEIYQTIYTEPDSSNPSIPSWFSKYGFSTSDVKVVYSPYDELYKPTIKLIHNDGSVAYIRWYDKYEMTWTGYWCFDSNMAGLWEDNSYVDTKHSTDKAISNFLTYTNDSAEYFFSSYQDCDYFWDFPLSAITSYDDGIQIFSLEQNNWINFNEYSCEKLGLGLLY